VLLHTTRPKLAMAEKRPELVLLALSDPVAKALPLTMAVAAPLPESTAKPPVAHDVADVLAAVPEHSDVELLDTEAVAFAKVAVAATDAQALYPTDATPVRVPTVAAMLELKPSMTTTLLRIVAKADTPQLTAPTLAAVPLDEAATEAALELLDVSAMAVFVRLTDAVDPALNATTPALATARDAADPVDAFDRLPVSSTKIAFDTLATADTVLRELPKATAPAHATAAVPPAAEQSALALLDSDTYAFETVMAAVTPR